MYCQKCGNQFEGRFCPVCGCDNDSRQEPSKSALIPAKCTNCGAELSVDATQENAVCSYCGASFIVSKAIQNFNIQNNVQHNVYQTNIINNTAQPRSGMTCRHCGSNNIIVSAVSEVREKRKRGLLYWCLIGFWLEPLLWLCFGIWKLLFEIFRKKTVIKSQTVTYAICQDCGHRWKV